MHEKGRSLRWSPDPRRFLNRTPLVFRQRTGSSLLNTDGSQLYLEPESLS